MKSTRVLAVAVIALVTGLLAANPAVAKRETNSLPSVQEMVKPQLFFPLVMKTNPVDGRFGIAEYTVEQANLLGFSNGRHISQQWAMPDGNSTLFFIRPASRTHAKSRWCLAAYRIAGHPDYCSDPTGNIISTSNGWIDPKGFAAFIQSRPGRAWIVGNEPLCAEPCGDGLNPTEYAQWHHDAYAFIKSVDPKSKVGQWGTMGIHEREFLLNFWAEYKRLYGEPLPSDFFATHHYAWPGWNLESYTQSLVDWIGWVESRRGVDWVGPRDYWLTEFGLPAWSVPVEESDAVRFMNGFIPWLKQNNLGISTWSWWPSCNQGWPDKCTKLLLKTGPTTLGKLYFKLAATP